MSGYNKLILFLVALIVFLAIILLIKINTTPQYNNNLYNEIYEEYEELFGTEDNINENSENVVTGTKESNNTTSENNIDTTNTETTTNTTQSNIIGKIIIPKIEIAYPIIKETTTEYLNIAPTKYCGPEVNEVRKFSNSGT